MSCLFSLTVCALYLSWELAIAAIQGFSASCTCDANGVQVSNFSCGVCACSNL